MGETKEFLQSGFWLHLQEAAGKETAPFGGGDFSANGIVHVLPLVGRYLYVPRGPRQDNFQFSSASWRTNFQKNIQTLVGLAREKKTKWVRIEPETDELLEEIKKNIPQKIAKAPHDMQPREVFKIDITRTEAELLAEMKSKTRYNIRLAEKHSVKVFETREKKYREVFLGLITATSGRKGITAHPKDYYEQFFRVLPEKLCRLFVAEYDGEVLSANLVVFYAETVTYLHGGSSDAHRDVMAPYLLQWEQIRTAKEEGYRFYDFGGVKTEADSSSWGGITKFKTGFSPQTRPTTYPGAYDIVLDSWAYFLYHVLRCGKKWLKIIIH